MQPKKHICNGCADKKFTVEMVPGINLCFECVEAKYQILAAEKSQELTQKSIKTMVRVSKKIEIARQKFYIKGFIQPKEMVKLELY